MVIQKRISIEKNALIYWERNQNVSQGEQTTANTKGSIRESEGMSMLYDNISQTGRS